MVLNQTVLRRSKQSFLLPAAFFLGTLFWFIALEYFAYEAEEHSYLHIHTFGISLYLIVSTWLIFKADQVITRSNRVHFKRLQKLIKRISKDRSNNEALLQSLPVSVWEEDFSEIKSYIDEAIKPASAEELRRWFDDNPEMASQLSNKVKIKSVSGTTLPMFRADTETELFENLGNIFTNKSNEAFKEEILTFFKGTPYFNVEAEQRRLNGEIFQTSTSVCIPKHGQARWDSVIATIEDIDDKKQSRAIVDNFFDLDMNLHLICRINGEILRVNSGWKTVLGYQPEELVGTNLLKLIHPDDLERTIDELSALDSGKPTYYFENRYRQKSGDYVTLSWSATSPLGDEFVYAVAADISERKAAEIKLRDAALVMNGTSEGVFLTDKEGFITDVNRSFEEITGYSRSEIVGKTPSILKSGRHSEEFYKSMWKTIASEGAWEGEVWNRKKNGEIFPELLKVSSVKDDQGDIVAYSGIFTDLSTIKNSEDEVIKLSTHDALTGLPNRGLLEEQLKQAIKHSKRNNSIVALILFDVDNFKYINESFGFKIGDKVIKMISERLIKAIRSEDIVARSSSDEYAILLENISYSKEATNIIENILSKFRTPFDVEGVEVHLSLSAGVGLFPHDGKSEDILIRNAESALFRAKQLGKGSYSFYSEELTEEATEYLLLENYLRVALIKNQFFLTYQPQINLKTGKLEGTEVLIRWEHPELGLIPPDKFIPIAEKSGLIREIGLWVLDSACYQAKRWLDSGYDFGRIAVNLSVSQLMQKNIITLIKRVLEETDLPSRYLELEVTESFAMKDLESCISLLNQIKELGIEVAIDDFGTGYSSLTYLKRLPIDKLKIDQAFVGEIEAEKDSLAIIDAIVALASSLNLKTIAEGVETQSQWTLLKEIGCEQGQGYHFSKPILPDELEKLYFKGAVTPSPIKNNHSTHNKDTPST